MTTRYSLVTTGKTGDSRNVDGTRVSSMGLAPQPVSSVRKKPTNPWFMPLGGPVEPQAESVASLLSIARGGARGTIAAQESTAPE